MPVIVTAANIGPHEGAVTLLSEAGCEVLRLPAGANAWTPELLQGYAARADAFVGTFRGVALTREVFAAAPRAVVATSPIIGVEHIDVAAATDLGLLVAHGAMAENFEGMAEAGVMLIAAMRKALRQKEQSFAAGEWKKAAPGQLVRGATIGLLGYGRISQGVARRLAGWDCSVIAHDPYVAADAGREHRVTLVSFGELLAQADVLVVLVTLTPETRHIINASAIAQMKAGACLINIGRGGCVDEAALTSALDDGRLSAAAIDTWEVEPPRLDHPLRNHPRVIGTSHDVGHSAELYRAIPEVAAENTLRALRGEAPLYLRNPAALPLWRERWARLQKSSDV